MSAMERLKAAWHDKVVDQIPAPMAAPETSDLRAARIRILVCLLVLALLTFFWSDLSEPAQRYAAAVVIGIGVFLLFQVPVWAITKWKADEAFLFRDRDGA